MTAKLLTTREAAARLGVTPIRVRALCEKGELPAVKFGRDWQIREKDVTRFSPRKVGRPRKEG